MKKGRHRRFEEARKLKQAGPSAFDLGFGGAERRPRTEEDEYAALAEKYGVVFDDDDETDDDTADDDTIVDVVAETRDGQDDGDTDDDGQESIDDESADVTAE